MYSDFHGEWVHPDRTHRLDQQLRSYFPDPECKGTMLDIGAYMPITNNNSYHFEQNEWDCFCFEPNPIAFSDLQGSRKNAYLYAISDQCNSKVEFSIVHSKTGGCAGLSALEVDKDLLESHNKNVKRIEKIWVKVRTLDDLLAHELHEVKQIDVVSVDVEGGEMAVFRGFDLARWKPKVLLVENWKGIEGNGSELQSYLESFGYKLDKRFGHDEFYLRMEHEG